MNMKESPYKQQYDPITKKPIWESGYSEIMLKRRKKSEIVVQYSFDIGPLSVVKYKNTYRTVTGKSYLYSNYKSDYGTGFEECNIHQICLLWWKLKMVWHIVRAKSNRNPFYRGK